MRLCLVLRRINLLFIRNKKNNTMESKITTDTLTTTMTESNKLNTIAIIGGNTLLGQHLIKYLIELDQNNNDQDGKTPFVDHIQVWDCNEPFHLRLDLTDKEKIISEKVSAFVGFDNLGDAVRNTTTVFNVYERQDFSLMPDKELLWESNVKFVDELMTCCSEANVRRVVHVSSFYVQSSNRWPNVNEPELTQTPPPNESVYPEYNDSKLESERIVFTRDNIQTFVVRLGPIYGEGDECSLICDAVHYAQRWSKLHVIGDRNGVLQLTYAGNVACGLVKLAQTMIEQPKLTREIVFVLDETPKKDVFSLVEPILAARHQTLSPDRFPTVSIHVLLLLYRIVCSVLLLIGRILPLSPTIRNLPSPSFVYFCLYHWTFFSPNKSRLLLDYIPLYSYDVALMRSIAYYRSIDVSKSRHQPSWLPH